MAFWLYSFNVPLVMNNFIYLVMFAAFAVGFGFLIYAAKAWKGIEEHLPVDEAYLEYAKEKDARKAAKKSESKKEAPKAE